MDEKQEKEAINEEEVKQQEIKAPVEQVQAEKEQIKKEENEEVITDPNKKNGSYITGTIGAILGGLIGSIPWILTYTFGNLIVAILAILIVGGAFLGYKMFKGRIGRALPAILTIVSLLVVTVVTTVICPIILMAQSEYPITLQNFLYLYSDIRAEVRAAILQDLAISLLFTIIGIAAVVRSISVQIKQGTNSKKIKFSTQPIYEELRTQLKEQTSVVKKVCTSLNCMSKESTVEKQDILNELEMTHSLEHKKAKQYFETCVVYKLLKKYKGKYYYDETDELVKIENIISGNTGKKLSGKTIATIILIAIVVGVVSGYIASNTNEDYYTVPNTDIKLEIDYKNQEFFGTAEEIGAAFGEEAVEYNDFIVMDKETKYELFGEVVEKEYYGEEYDMATIIQVTRDYYAQVMGEDIVGEVEEKELDGDIFRRFKYDYEGEQGEEYTSITYIYETEENYLWIYVYTDRDFEMAQVDTVVDNLMK